MLKAPFGVPEKHIIKAAHHILTLSIKGKKANIDERIKIITRICILGDIADDYS